MCIVTCFDKRVFVVFVDILFFSVVSLVVFYFCLVMTDLVKLFILYTCDVTPRPPLFCIVVPVETAPPPPAYTVLDGASTDKVMTGRCCVNVRSMVADCLPGRLQVVTPSAS